MSAVFFDENGKEMSLLVVCRTHPQYAYNEIRRYKALCAAKDHRIAALELQLDVRGTDDVRHNS